MTRGRSASQARKEAQGKVKEKLVILGISSLGGVILIAAGIVVSNIPGSKAVLPESVEISQDCLGSNQAVSSCPSREQFLEARRVYDRDIAPEIQRVSLLQWSPEIGQQIDETQTKAIRAFESGDYRGALGLIEQANEMARVEFERGQELFRVNLQAAIDAHKVGNFSGALEAIEMALLLEPADQSALNYAERITVLPDILLLLDEAYNARIENRYRIELGVLQNIQQLDAARTELLSRIEYLTQQIAEVGFTSAISRAEQALGESDVTTARSALQQASSLFPARDLRFISDKIDQLVMLNTIATLLQEASSAKATENWTLAVSKYSEVLQLESANTLAQEGVKISEGVILGLQQAQSYLEDPLRLGTVSIANTARNSLEMMSAFYGESPTLDIQIGMLQSYLEKATVPIKLQIISDNKTDISVRGIGIIGNVLDKTIELPPGEYALEGRRDGYRSVLVPLTVNFDDTNLSAEVICNEKI